ncbi:lipoprotein insertase outer membrane protein LolB [Volucribacter amazonae]|uniref:Outer-membrane lipoprotein LolB n=1 Tax=Volucribacter amazonae TaxID=256731 RepID=A0A9X4PBT0_9PAST|nr:lipoprotein insertase outer membrane protein LolB [Volucribacter amazonae]MDG6894349.1 lipoprotein localization factor LolB [Volucribacter amazonae]
MLKIIPSLKRLVIISLSILIVACSVTDERPSEVRYIDPQDPTWLAHLQKIQQIRSYAANGQLGYISANDRFSSRFDWRYQNPQSYQLQLSSMLTSTTLSIVMTPQGMSISDNRGNQHNAQDAQQLLREIIGMDFPLAQFSDWLKGQPDLAQPYYVGENHLLTHFDYVQPTDSWTVDYLSYHSQETPALPKDIVIKNQDKTLKIRVDNWIY